MQRPMVTYFGSITDIKDREDLTLNDQLNPASKRGLNTKDGSYCSGIGTNEFFQT